MMRASIPTLTETETAIIIRILKTWVSQPRARTLTVSDVLRLVSKGQREFRKGKTHRFDTFLTQHYPAYARTFRRSR